MNSEESNISNENNICSLKDIDTYINRMQNMLDWISTARENVANMNLELYTLFNPVEAFLEKNKNLFQDFVEVECVLQNDCQTIINKVELNLSKLSEDNDNDK